MEAMYKYLPDNKINWNLILNELLMPFKDSLEKTNQEMKLNTSQLTATNMLKEEPKHSPTSQRELQEKLFVNTKISSSKL